MFCSCMCLSPLFYLVHEYLNTRAPIRYSMYRTCHSLFVGYLFDKYCSMQSNLWRMEAAQPWGIRTSTLPPHAHHRERVTGRIVRAQRR